jgi:hypothetical protein
VASYVISTGWIVSVVFSSVFVVWTKAFVVFPSVFVVWTRAFVVFPIVFVVWTRAFVVFPIVFVVSASVFVLARQPLCARAKGGGDQAVPNSAGSRVPLGPCAK